MREVILRFDVCGYPLVFFAVFTLARNMMRLRPRMAPAMVWTAIAGFLGVAALGCQEFQWPQGLEILAILVTSGIAGCTAALAVFVIAPPFVALADQAKSERERREAERKRKKELAEQQKKAEEELQRLNLLRDQERQREREREEWRRLNPPPPPPTREEKAAEAKRRFEFALLLLDTSSLDAVELASARAQAKQKYLAELDRVMQ